MALVPTTSSSASATTSPTSVSATTSSSTTTTAAPSVSVLPIDAVASRVLQSLLHSVQRMGSVPSSSALSGAEVPSTPSLAVSQAAGAVNCESSVIFIHSFLVALAYVPFGARVFASFFSIAESVCVPLGGGVLHQLSVAASVCVPLGGGVLHQLSLAASVCVPLGGEVLHQLSIAALVCVPLGENLCTSFLSVFPSLVRYPLRRWVGCILPYAAAITTCSPFWFSELLMPRAVSCFPTVLWVRSLLVASSQSPSSYCLVAALQSIGLFGSYPL